jgi:hypothetical protein
MSRKKANEQNQRADEIIENLNQPVVDPEEEAYQAPEEEDWKQKYDVLQGKYNKEVKEVRTQAESIPGLYDELTEQKIKNSELAAELKSLRDKVEEKVEEKIPEGVEYLKKELPDVESAIQYYVNKHMKDSTQDILGKVSSKVESIESTVKDTTRGVFESELAMRVPEWKSLNRNPDFLSWLEQIEPFSGTSRLDLLRSAQLRGDAVTASNFFLSFMDEKGIKSQNLSSFTHTPKETTHTSPPNREVKNVITRDFVKKFYRDITDGKYKGREKKAREIEEKINEATATGMIV